MWTKCGQSVDRVWTECGQSEELRPSGVAAMASSCAVATGNSRKGKQNRNLVAPLEPGATDSAKKRRRREVEKFGRRALRAERRAAAEVQTAAAEVAVAAQAAAAQAAVAQAAAAQAAEQLAMEQLAAEQLAAQLLAAKKERKKKEKKERKEKEKKEKKEKEKKEKRRREEEVAQKAARAAARAAEHEQDLAELWAQAELRSPLWVQAELRVHRWRVRFPPHVAGDCTSHRTHEGLCSPLLPLSIIIANLDP
eukprot:COSAG06_NODE_220_length_19986_cov_94.824257_10_plen_252_part_00